MRRCIVSVGDTNLKSTVYTKRVWKRDNLFGERVLYLSRTNIPNPELKCRTNELQLYKGCIFNDTTWPDCTASLAPCDNTSLWYTRRCNNNLKLKVTLNTLPYTVNKSLFKIQYGSCLSEARVRRYLNSIESLNLLENLTSLTQVLTTDPVKNT